MSSTSVRGTSRVKVCVRAYHSVKFMSSNVIRDGMLNNHKNCFSHDIPTFGFEEVATDRNCFTRCRIYVSSCSLCTSNRSVWFCRSVFMVLRK
jgi:hypothetical protein